MDKQIEHEIFSKLVKRLEYIKIVPSKWYVKYKTEYYTRGNYIVVKITTDEDVNIIGLGIAKRNPSDVFNEEIGQKIAFSRAIIDYLYNITNSSHMDSYSSHMVSNC